MNTRGPAGSKPAGPDPNPTHRPGDTVANRLTEQQLAAIEARTTAATKGPWGTYEFGGDTLIEIAADLEETGTGYRARREVCRMEDEPLDNDPAHREWTAEEDWAQIQADAEFVAHAREDVPVLLAEIRRLQARVRELERPAIGADIAELRRMADETAAAEAHPDRGGTDAEFIAARQRYETAKARQDGSAS